LTSVIHYTVYYSAFRHTVWCNCNKCQQWYLLITGISKTYVSLLI